MFWFFGWVTFAALGYAVFELLRGKARGIGRYYVELYIDDDAEKIRWMIKEMRKRGLTIKGFRIHNAKPKRQPTILGEIRRGDRRILMVPEEELFKLRVKPKLRRPKVKKPELRKPKPPEKEKREEAIKMLNVYDDWETTPIWW